MSELPKGWSETTFGEICGAGQYGWTTKASGHGKTKYLRTTDITKGPINWDTVPFCLEEPADASKYQIKKDDILISRAGSVGFSTLVGDHSYKVVFASYLIRYAPTPAVDPRYAIHFLKTDDYWSQISGVAAGIALANVNATKLAELSVPLAPLAEQKRIADKLDVLLARVDATRERLDCIPTLLKRFRQSVLAAATSGRLTEDWRAENPSIQSDGPVHHRSDSAADVKLEMKEYLSRRAKSEKKPPAQPDLSNWDGEIPSSWMIASVNQFSECLDRFRIPIKRDDRKNTKGLYPYFGANGEVGKIDDFIFDDELVLVTEDETFYGREKPIAYRSSGKCWVNNHAHVLRPRSKADADYLCYALMYYNVIPWLTGTTGRAKLTQQALNSLPIAVPPQVEVAEIVRRVEALFALADKVEARYTTARAQVDKLTPALLAKAFRGELVEQDPNDEPAEQLLARLRAARDTTPRARRSRKSRQDREHA